MYEFNNIRIDDKSQYWIYMINDNMWKILLNNFNENKLNISVFNKTPVLENDVILIYVKSTQSKGSGFVAVGQVQNDMIKNNDKIKIFGDLNTDKYVAQMDSIYFLNSDRIKISEFKNVFLNTTEFKSTQQFISHMLTGECVLNHLKYPKIGLEFVKIILKLIDEHISEQNSQSQSQSSGKSRSNDKSKSNDKSTYSSTHSSIEDDNISTSISDISNQSDISDIDTNDTDTDSHNSDSGSDNSDNSDDSGDSENSNDDKEIMTMIPIMIVPCKDLISNIIEYKKKNKFNLIKLIIQHHNECQDCDVTNNNNKKPLEKTLNRLKIKNILYQINDHEECLNSYHCLKPYPDDENLLYCKIYWIKNDPDFSKCLLVEYTSIR